MSSDNLPSVTKKQVFGRHNIHLPKSDYMSSDNLPSVTKKQVFGRHNIHLSKSDYMSSDNLSSATEAGSKVPVFRVKSWVQIPGGKSGYTFCNAK